VVSEWFNLFIGMKRLTILKSPGKLWPSIETG